MGNLETIIHSGYPQMGSNVSQSAALTGLKAKFVFSCPKCKSKIETQNEYPLSDNMGKTMIKSSISSGISSLVYALLRRIPFVGYLLSSFASNAIHTAVHSTSGNPMEKSQKKAFEEIKSRFSACTKCSQIACVSCLTAGICQDCQVASA